MKRANVFAAAILAAVLCISGTVFAVLSGDGSAGNPYLIQSRADFDVFANPANAATYWADGVYTKLMCDPNLSGTTYTQAVVAPDTDNTQYNGFQGTQFVGIFDGNNHIISNLTITAPTKDYVGLFGYVGSGGQIKNLSVENIAITGRSYVGGLAGMNGGTIISCYATGLVGGTDSVGGLAGWNYNGSLISCYATGAVSGSDYIGGLMGYNDQNMLTACYATGAVSGTGEYVGGLVGYNWGLLTSCYATGAVSGTDWYIGGLVGANDGTLTSCYATGSATGNYCVGGLVGYNNQGVLTACYATGAVSGTGNFVGGLVGANWGLLTSCYATDAVIGTGDYVGGLVGANWSLLTSCYATGSVTGTIRAGGLVGENYGTLTTSCFWDTQTCLPVTVGVGSGPATGVTGKTTAQMKTLSTFTSAGWDFASVWAMPLGQYPVLFLRQMGDLNSDARVDMQDLAILAANWLEGI
jgi:hypothetical protein